MSPTSNPPPGESPPQPTPAARRLLRRERRASDGGGGLPALPQLLALPRGELVAHLLALPQRDRTLWVGGRLATPRADADCPHGTDCCAWVDARNFRTYTLDLVDRDQDMECLVHAFIKAMAWPNDGLEPFRPARVVVSDPHERAVLLPLARDLGVRFVRRPRAVEELVEIVQQLTYQASPASGLLGQEGVTPEIVRRYFEAAARFYRRPPAVDASAGGVVRIDGLEPSPLFVCVGSRCAAPGGATISLDEDRGHHALTVLPCSQATLSPHLLDEARQCGWKDAPEAGYPLLVSGADTQGELLPTAQELILATRVLRILRRVPFHEGRRWVGRGSVDTLPVRVEWPVDLPPAQA